MYPLFPEKYINWRLSLCPSRCPSGPSGGASWFIILWEGSEGGPSRMLPAEDAVLPPFAKALNFDFD